MIMGLDPNEKRKTEHIIDNKSEQNDILERNYFVCHSYSEEAEKKMSKYCFSVSSPVCGWMNFDYS